MSPSSANAVAHDTHGHDEHHDGQSNTVLGFWLYLMTDCILFASVFATYGVLFNSTAGGVSGKDIFELSYVLIETFALLLSSITCGFAMVCVDKNKRAAALRWLSVTFLFGAVFIAMEVYEFHHLITAGHGPDASAFLSAFFALVGMHGIHVTVGLIWMLTLMSEVSCCGLTQRATTRLSCLSLFWHFLDIVWICVFSVVYLLEMI